MKEAREKKKVVYMRVAVHPIKARLWEAGIAGKIPPGTSLREAGKVVGEKSAQVIKHHLETLVKMGAIDHVSGDYVFPIKITEKLCNQ